MLQQFGMENIKFVASIYVSSALEILFFQSKLEGGIWKRITYRTLSLLRRLYLKKIIAYIKNAWSHTFRSPHAFTTCTWQIYVYHCLYNKHVRKL